MNEFVVVHHTYPGGSGKRRLPMVCPFAIGKAFGLAAATRVASPSAIVYLRQIVSGV
jgi:hypothetical protein